MSEPEFHQLRVTEVSPLTEDSVAVTFDVPDQLSETFAYLPGQHVTVRAFIADEDVRRSYSICANANSDKLRVGIKRLPGGAFSTYATADLKAGDVLDVMAPVGDFTIDINPSSPRRAVAIAVGSGITPVISLIATSLESEPFANWTLLFGNRTANSI
ncbi:MAG: FAD-binding oxidoreductase, partial [Acidimicrobiia bacterium]